MPPAAALTRSASFAYLQLMNVEGLTRENVASHLQKFRLYTRRLNDAAGRRRGPDASDDEDGDDGAGGSGGA